ncbi:MAG: hypothetical protein WC346_17325 [Methanogenium sp.]|jgi:hypothetical protein
MCDLVEKYQGEEFTGWKVVAVEKITGKRYSVAMGFCYDDYDEIPICCVQNQIGNFFVPDILVSNTFNREMRGRTAVFLVKEGAETLCSQIKRESFYVNRFTFQILKAKVSIDLMKGIFNNLFKAYPVVAGRRIEFLPDEV